MAHRDDHAAALARAAALERDLKRARTRADRAERRATDAERRATDAERRATAVAAQEPRVIATPAPAACSYYDDRPGGGVVFVYLLLILMASIGAVVGVLWLTVRW